VIQDDTQKAISLATAQVIDFYIDSISSDDQGILHTIACIGRKLKILPREKPLKILNCGNPFVSGEHGIFIQQNQDKRKVIRTLAKALLSYTQQRFNFSIDVFIMKDFVEESLPISNELISLGYYAFNVEPNMKMELSADWRSFDEYLSALKTKFRVKAKKALKISKDLQVESMTAENLVDHLKSMTELYLTVTSKASFNLGEFRLKTYQQLKETLGDHYLLQSYSLNGKLVGFLSGVINGTSLDAHFVGIDYPLNKSYGIYQRMLYDYIQIAIDKRLKTINFGRTASEIKSSVGAVPEHLTIYIRHKKTITNKFLRLFLQRIQPTEFNQKFPFKQASPNL
jgi:predicted N-acyltransferase